MADATSGIGDKVKKAWEMVKPNLVTWIVCLIIGGLMNYVFLGGVAMAGWAILMAKSKAGEKIEIGDMFKAFDRFVDYFVLGLFNMVCIPALWTPYSIMYSVEKKADFMTSFKWGLAFFLKNLVPCIITIVVAVVLIIIGEICCIVGVFVTAPIALNFMYLFYEETKGTTPDGAQPEAPKV
jgi:hypothetical protein